MTQKLPQSMPFVWRCAAGHTWTAGEAYPPPCPTCARPPISRLPASRTAVSSTTSTGMHPRAELEEKVLRALAEAVERVLNETGLQVDSATFTWADVTTVESRLTKRKLAKVTMKSTVTTRERT